MEDIGQLGPALFFMLIFFGIIFLVTFFRFVPVGLWITAMASGVKVSMFQLIGMRLRFEPRASRDARICIQLYCGCLVRQPGL